MKEKSPAFTLIEVLLYVSMTSVISITAIGLFTTIIQVRNRNQVISEVNQNANQVLAQITQQVRNGTTINTPAAGATGNVLSINGTDAVLNPTVWQLSGNTLTVQEGAATAVNLTSDRIRVDSVTFTHTTAGTAKGTIKIVLVVSHINPDGRGDLSYTQTYHATAALR